MRESTEEVVECLILEDETGETHEVEIPGVCFDPESWSSDETMDQVAADLDLPKKMPGIASQKPTCDEQGNRIQRQIIFPINNLAAGYRVLSVHFCPKVQFT